MSQKKVEAANDKKPSKSSLIRRMLSNSPALKNPDIAEILTKQGRPTTAQEVAAQRSILKRQPQAPLNVDDLKTIKQVVKDSGGIKKVTALLDEFEKIADAAGGERKLREGLVVLKELSETAS